jgi:hypothetical protein
MPRTGQTTIEVDLAVCSGSELNRVPSVLRHISKPGDHLLDMNPVGIMRGFKAPTLHDFDVIFRWFRF